MRLTAIADQTIKPCDNRMIDFREEGDIPDIIDAILIEVRQSEDDTAKFAQNLSKNTEYETLKAVYHFVKRNLKYKRDRAGHEVIKSASCAYHLRHRGNDCKSLSIMIGSLLHNLGFRYKLRFIWQDREQPNQGHVYPVAVLDSGREVILDAVHDHFDEEVAYWKKVDYGPFGAALSGIHGVGNRSSFFENIFQAATSVALGLMILEWLK